MSHDYANKYANYWSEKNKDYQNWSGANCKAAGRQKTSQCRKPAAIAESTVKSKYPELH